MENGRATVPLAQARSLRNVAVHSASFKAVDWMFFVLSSGEAVLADRVPDNVFNTFMDLSSRLVLHAPKPGACERFTLDHARSRPNHALFGA